MYDNHKDYKQIREEFLSVYQREIYPQIKTYKQECIKAINNRDTFVRSIFLYNILGIIHSLIYLCVMLAPIALLITCFAIPKDMLDQIFEQVTNTIYPMLIIPVILIIYFAPIIIVSSIVNSLYNRIASLPLLYVELDEKIKNIVIPSICSSFEKLDYKRNIIKGNNELELMKAMYTEEIIQELYDSGIFSPVDKLILNLPANKTGNNTNNKEPEVSLDNFEGTYKNAEFKIFENMGRCIIIVNLKKDFSSHTILVKHGKQNYTNLKRTELEDVEFEKIYNAYTNDGIEARYILTPLLIKQIDELNFAFKQYPDRISFYKQKMYIEFFKPYRNWFPATEYNENTIKIYEDIEAILRLIDFLIRHLESQNIMEMVK